MRELHHITPLCQSAAHQRAVGFCCAQEIGRGGQEEKNRQWHKEHHDVASIVEQVQLVAQWASGFQPCGKPQASYQLRLRGKKEKDCASAAVGQPVSRVFDLTSLH
jgi:hypothetical protein